MSELGEKLKRLPSIEKLITHPALSGWSEKLSHDVRVRLARETVASLREAVSRGDAEPEGAAEALEASYRALVESGMRKVINATGVVLHTNLGRAPLGRAWLEDMARELDGYASLELDETTGERGSRSARVERLAGLVTGAEAALVVNNNAAALFLALHALARGKGVVLSRGELVQIGGGFRVPDILESSGARLIEVGTTNMTSVKDYERAIADEANLGCVLRVHQSNFAIVGHTESADPRELHRVAKTAGVPFVIDLGSGAVSDEGIEEPTIAQALATGADLVAISGDKCLGGPQAGILLGKRDLIAKLKQSPLYRALRLGKTELYLLERTLESYLKGVPPLAVRLMRLTAEEIGHRAEKLREASGLTKASLVPGTSRIGGGSSPLVELPTILLELPESTDSESVARRLLAARPAVAVRRENKRLRLDLRTVLVEEEPTLARLLRDVLGS